MTKDLNTEELETCGTEGMMRIFGLSRVSIYRRTREALAGRGGFPLPIPAGPKKRLRWNVDTVRKFVENTESTLPTSKPLMESTAKRETRKRAAMKELEKLGIKVPQKEQE